MSWITNTNIASYTRKTYAAAEQTELDRLCNAVEAAFKGETRRDYPDVADDTIVEYFQTPQKTNTFRLKNTPATEIVSVEYYDQVSEAYATYDDDKWLVDGYKIILNTFVYDSVPNYIKISYKAETAPYDVVQALIEWVLLIWNSRFDAGQLSKSKQAGTTRKDYLVIDNLPANIKSVINRYRIPHV